MAEEPQIQSKLPENAYRELKPDEQYVPMVPPSVTVPEITVRSIIFGIVMNIVFAMAATYLALKVGQGIETAIPISILAVGLSGFVARFGLRRSTLVENINILAVSTTSGIVAGGCCFTMPAIYILKLHEKLDMTNWSLFFQISLVPFLGAVLGVVFLVPFRRYFVKDMHGKLPFPEGTATNEILVTGAGGGAGQAWILIYSFIIGMIYNFLSGGLRLFQEVFTTGKAVLEVAGTKIETFAIPALAHLTEKVKAVFFLGTGAEYCGLGLIIGLRYASIICAGSFLSWFVIVPLLGSLSLESLQLINPDITGTAAGDIFKKIPRNIGIGGIFAAGLLSILKMSKVIVTALRQALGGIFKSNGAGGGHDRTDEDISYPVLLIIGLLTTIAIFLYFRFSVLAHMEDATRLTIISVLLALGIAFLFTTVSAWAIAMISVTPISGMTVTTIIITAVALLAAGLPKDETGMLATLLVGGVVCTALSMAGTLVTEFKLGYWLGASPKRIQWSAITFSLLASVLVTATIMILAHQRGYDSEESTTALAAPQANVMASALKSFIGGGGVPWLMYGTGVVITLLIELVGVSGLAFSLGMYLPMELNTPILAGAIIGSLIKKSSRKKAVCKLRNDKAILIASGLIAGGAIIGVLTSGLAILDDEVFKKTKIMDSIDVQKRMIENRGGDISIYEGADVDRAGAADQAAAEPPGEALAESASQAPAAEGTVQADEGTAKALRFGNWLGLIAFVLLCLFVYLDSCRVKPPPEAK